ncbi:NAD-binding protein [Thermovibrio ammonificans]|jgi:trk system potassium uptake protein TrkA
MRVAIIGAGVVGSYLAKRLSKEGYEVAVVDVDPSKVEQIAYSYDVLGTTCNALEVNCLKQIKDFDLFIVVTENDEKNVSIAVLLRSLFQKKHIIVRVNNKAFSSPPVKELLGYETVNVLSEVVTTVVMAVRYPFALSVSRLENEGLLIFKYEIKVEDFLAGKRLEELQEARRSVEFTVVAVEREGEILIPNGKTTLYPGDKIYVAVKEQDVYRLLETLQISYTPTRLVFVLGYSRYTDEILLKLSETKEVTVKFISPDLSVCEEIAGKFPNVMVLHGEPTDVELLKEEEIEKADLTVAVSDDEESNVLSAILAKKFKCKRACALIFHPEYETIIESIGVDIPIVPRKLIASKVYRSLSKRAVLEFLELAENLDVIEIRVSAERSFKVKEAKQFLKGECNLIIAIKRGNTVLLATGETVIEPGDTVICVKRR